MTETPPSPELAQVDYPKAPGTAAAQPQGGPLGPDWLAGRVALVTGGSGGIGRSLAAMLAQAGAAVAVGYAANAAPAQAAADRIVQNGGQALAMHADLLRPQAAAELADAVEGSLGPVDILISNAGLGHRQKFEDVTTADFDEMIAVNLRSPFLLAQRIVPVMADRGFGRVLFVSSVAAFTGGIVGPHYAASKSGLHGLTHYLAARFARAGVTVNTLAPALIAETGLLPGEPEHLRHQVPVGRLGQPEEVADLAMAILRNPYLTSQIVALDGGMYPR
jgi:3-oxoacyl-[acyl-carrier protein] reductase